MAVAEAWEEFKDTIDGAPFLVSTLINKECYATTLLDTGCLSYRVIDSRFATRHNLQRFTIPPIEMSSFEAVTSPVTEVAVIEMDIEGHREARAFFYVVPYLADYDLILGLPWFKKHDVRMIVPQSRCYITATATTLRNQAIEPKHQIDCISILAVAFNRLTRGKRRKQLQVFAASMADIQKALASKGEDRSSDKTPRMVARISRFI